MAALLAAALLCNAHADTVRVATASNFLVPMQALAQAFEADDGTRVEVISGSTGSLFAQISAGAPFDMFFAADRRRPRALVDAGLVSADSFYTYARGRLALWRPAGDASRQRLRQCLADAACGYLAIANPAVAPYGAAAKQTLQALDLWQAAAGRLVRGENISQAYQLVASGAAEMGFVALSQLKGPRSVPQTQFWLVPDALHQPIEQGAVLLKRGAERAAARAFWAYIRSPASRRRIADFGYRSEP